MNTLIKPKNNLIKKCMTAIILLIGTLLVTSSIYGQSGDLSQIRNGNGVEKNGVLDACGDCWVNGNAGAQNAHYTEGMSIAYRSLITGLTPGTCYEYEIGYDTYHSAMAIDYLTHFQRLQPHGPFGHPAEVINPLVFVSGSTKYTMPALSTNTFAIPAPAPSGITSGAFNKDGSPRDVSNQALTSFNALPEAERLMTIYNGIIQDINYVSQATIVIGGADAETRVRIRFQAQDDSVVLAWGGHIASRLDWGYTVKQSKLVPLSAGGIAGSPYHMRQKAFDRVTCDANPDNPTQVLQNISGFGNQDRSLAAAAVFPPPECPTVTSQTQCYENQTFNFSIDAPEAGVVYNWSFGTNTVGATFQGGGATASGTSVTVVANPGADVQGVDNGGSFTLNITAVLNGVSQECPGVATGTVVDVDVAASADPTSINLATGSSSALSVTSIAPGTTADYNFVWSVVTIPPNGDASITGAAADGSATFNVLSPYQTGTYVARVVATQKTTPFCKDSADVTIEVSGGLPPCGIFGEDLVCPGSTHTYIYDPDGDEVANAIPDNFTAQWTFSSNSSGATFDGSTTGNSVDVIAGTECDKSYTVRITLTSTSGLLSTYCEITVSVNDTEPPVITCPADATLECGDSSDPQDTGEATATDNCSATVTYEDATSSNCNITVITRTWTATDPCGNTSSCVQLIIIKDTEAPEITCQADGSITVTDNCSATGNIVTYFKDENGIRNWTAVDERGNTSTKACPLPAPITQVNNTSTPVTESVQSNNIKLADRQLNNVDVQKTDLQSRVTPSQVIGDASELKVKAYPNPFNNTVNFNFISPVSGKVSLEAYDMLGRRVAIIYQGMVDAGSPKTVTYNVSEYNKVPLVYKMSVGELTTHGKLLPMKRE